MSDAQPSAAWKAAVGQQPTVGRPQDGSDERGSQQQLDGALDHQGAIRAEAGAFLIDRPRHLDDQRDQGPDRHQGDQCCANHQNGTADVGAPFSEK